jgi:hypothetical protein
MAAAAAGEVEGATVKREERAAIEVGDPIQTEPAAPDRPESERPVAMSDDWEQELPWPGQMVSSQVAGLFFITPILDHLDIAGFLQRHPDWLAYQFPTHLLRWIVQEAGAEDGDPMLALLATSPAEVKAFEFVAPATWRQEIMQDGPCSLHAVSARPGVRALFDSSGELPLALWSGRMPEALPALLGQQTPQDQAPLPEVDPASLLLSAWSTAASRWLQRFTPLSLPDLVQRSGRIAATRTHIDVFFDMQQTDIEVRRAGLDFDPGWVVWLGRVIHFHYVSDDADVSL